MYVLAGIEKRAFSSFSQYTATVTYFTADLLLVILMIIMVSMQST